MVRMSTEVQPDAAPPKRPGRIVAAAVVAVVVAGALIVGLTRGGDTPRLADGPKLDGTKPLPAISGKDLDGAPLDLASFQGKPLIVNVWGSWCLPCRREAPDILRFTKEHPEVAFAGIDYDERNVANGADFNREAGWTHRSIFDPKGKIGVQPLKITALPTTIYIDAKGVIRGETRGPVTYDDLVAVAARL